MILSRFGGTTEGRRGGREREREREEKQEGWAWESNFGKVCAKSLLLWRIVANNALRISNIDPATWSLLKLPAPHRSNGVTSYGVGLWWPMFGKHTILIGDKANARPIFAGMQPTDGSSRLRVSNNSRGNFNPETQQRCPFSRETQPPTYEKSLLPFSTYIYIRERKR